MTALTMTSATIDLNSEWELEQVSGDVSVPVTVPFDVHSALLDAGLIEDPYWRDREVSLDWVHEAEWVVTRKVAITDTDLSGNWQLRFDVIDCFATVEVNGTVVGESRSAYIRHSFDVGSALIAGENTIRVTFHSNSKAAVEAAEAFPFKLPYLDWNCRIPDVNLIRKPACHAGWDWGIALMPLGLFGDVTLVRSRLVSLEEIKVVQHHRDGKVRLEVTAYGVGADNGNAKLSVSYGDQVIEQQVVVASGENSFGVTLDVEDPQLWWPAGHGAQVLTDLTVRLDGHQIKRRVGLRNVELITTPDEIGERFAFAVNGVEIFMKGANWIPADALPQQATPEFVRDLLESAVAANMNMIRVWGGGQYEADWFYDLCDELGLMIWHDFMFACNHYPGADYDWLNLVRKEARQNIRRLSTHASMALWCGDNELIGALNWFPETKANRDRYLANYVILNHALEEVVHQEQPDVPFWPSSPSSGRLNFGDAWHDDRSGDMHFWDVWHSAKDFEHYRTVKPRFCSEFGFQSFPSMTAIERFTLPEDRNISSPVMDTHQRNVGGNSRIVETIARNFRFPDAFEDMVYLSQVSQALAMKTSIEYWRAQTPRCMGTLYWQLNDNWPVASWSSLEHGGAWKLCHYMARNFYAPVLLTAQPAEDGSDDIIVHAVSDVSAGAVKLDVAVSAVDISGGSRRIETKTLDLPYNQAIDAVRVPAGTLVATEFLHIQWSREDGAHAGENTYFPKRYKAYDLPKASVTQDWVEQDGTWFLKLSSDVPAFFVVAELGGNTTFGDGGFLLLPDAPKLIAVNATIDPTSEVKVQYLNSR